LENDPEIFRVDETGEIIESFQTDLDKMNIWQLVFVDEHYFYGEVWFTNNSGVIGQVMLEEGQGIKVTSFAAPANVSYALTHDNTDLWYGKAGGVIYVVDDGINEVNWLKITPDLSTIPASTQKDINLHFDASGFEEGTYHANLVILSNDQDEENIRVPVDLLVTGIDLGADTSFCGHLSVVLDAGEGYAGYRWSDGSTGQTIAVDSIGYGLGAAILWVDVTDIGGTVRRDSVSINFLDCTSVFEFSSGLKVTVYPNPSHGIFELRAEDLKNDLNISVSDIRGQVILQRTLEAANGNSASQIDMSGYPKGTYLLQISDGDGFKVQRIILN
jgi:hypothetical protein